MEALIQLVQGSLSYLVPMTILLGLLIFVHELGHFLVAKYYKIRVEVFSLGFGPKIFKFKRGDTVYAISAIPLGGYVKMFGDDPTAEVSSDQKAYSFINKPVGQRIAVVLAGPLMNFFFAILLFAAVAMIGEQTLAPEVGDIQTTSVAYQAGFRSGDKIVSVDSQPVTTWEEASSLIESNAGNQILVEVERMAGGREQIQVSPALAKNKNILSWNREVGDIEGLTFASRASLVGIKDPLSPAGKAGLKTGDAIQSLNGSPITRWRQLVDEISKLDLSKGPLQLEVERGLLATKKNAKTEKLTISIELGTIGSAQTAEQRLVALGIESPELYIAGVEKDSPAAAAGILTGDRLLSINGKELTSFQEVASIIRSYGNANEGSSETIKPLEIIVARNGVIQNYSIAPNMKERMNAQGKEERRFEVGIRPVIAEAAPTTVTRMADSPLAAVSRGIQQTVKWTNLTVLSFVRLFQNEVSAKNIGGFLSIGQMAQKSWQVGINQFLTVMGIISINLFILNLLPVPVLDGGHLVFYSIEALRGAPLSMRKMEIAQQVGMVLLLGLMVFALFNDISRLFNPW